MLVIFFNNQTSNCLLSWLKGVYISSYLKFFYFGVRVYISYYIAKMKGGYSCNCTPGKRSKAAAVPGGRTVGQHDKSRVTGGMPRPVESQY